MRKTEFVHTYFCDLCGNQGPEESMSPAYGDRRSDTSSCTHFGVDICYACLQRPIADLMDLLRDRGNR